MPLLTNIFKITNLKGTSNIKLKYFVRCTFIQIFGCTVGLSLGFGFGLGLGLCFGDTALALHMYDLGLGVDTAGLTRD